MNECYKCGFYDTDYGCTCYSHDMWYACPIENKKPENIKALKEYAEWVKSEGERRRLCRENYKRQLDMLGYNADGNPKREEE